jgi:hypothetical protein
MTISDHMSRNWGKKIIPKKKKQKKGERKISPATNKQRWYVSGKQTKAERQTICSRAFRVQTEWQSAHIHQKSSKSSKRKDRKKLGGV